MRFEHWGMKRFSLHIICLQFTMQSVILSSVLKKNTKTSFHSVLYNTEIHVYLDMLTACNSIFNTSNGSFITLLQAANSSKYISELKRKCSITLYYCTPHMICRCCFRIFFEHITYRQVLRKTK